MSKNRSAGLCSVRSDETSVKLSERDRRAIQEQQTETDGRRGRHNGPERLNEIESPYRERGEARQAGVNEIEPRAGMRVARGMGVETGEEAKEPPFQCRRAADKDTQKTPNNDSTASCTDPKHPAPGSEPNGRTSRDRTADPTDC